MNYCNLNYYWNSEPKDANNNPMNASTPISSTTSSNGFLISDVDSANHWSGGGATGTELSFINTEREAMSSVS